MRLLGRVINRLKTLYQSARDVSIGTYEKPRILTSPLSQFFRSFRDHGSIRAVPPIPALLNHQFDLLGSGWIQVKHGANCRGVLGCRYDPGATVIPDSRGEWLIGRINQSNLERSQAVWKLLQPAYSPIDWQLDFRSGFRWLESTPSSRIRYGNLPGVDIKVPWELARMQHLPGLAWSYAASQSGPESKTRSEVYRMEFRNEILDFIATNPPRFGVNWVCTMDVAIRVVNWLVAYDLFSCFGAEWDPEFRAELVASVRAHGRHVAAHLDQDFRGNHYLADVAGLLFVGAYLDLDSETAGWLARAGRGFVDAIEEQFWPEGSNFEGSVYYHRLSTEIVTYCVALVQALPEAKVKAFVSAIRGIGYQSASSSNRLPRKVVERIERMGEFAVHVMKGAGDAPQIGDNDSGRFLKLFPEYRRMTVAEAKKRYSNLEGYSELPETEEYWDEDVLNTRHLVAALSGLFGRDDWRLAIGDHPETKVIEALTRQGAPLTTSGLPAAAMSVRIGGASDLDSWRRKLGKSLECHSAKVDFPARLEASRVALFGYPSFGLFLYRSDQLYLGIRCGLLGQRGNGGHDHNDQLGVELQACGQDMLADPGSYVYTASPEHRNAYRSVRAHFSPQPLNDLEPASLQQGLFRLGRDPEAKCLVFTEKGFVGVHHGFGVPVYRFVLLGEFGLTIEDYGPEGLLGPVLPQGWDSRIGGPSKLPYCEGYGKRRNRSMNPVDRTSGSVVSRDRA